MSEKYSEYDVYIEASRHDKLAREAQEHARTANMLRQLMHRCKEAEVEIERLRGKDSTKRTGEVAAPRSTADAYDWPEKDQFGNTFSSDLPYRGGER